MSPLGFLRVAAVTAAGTSLRICAAVRRRASVRRLQVPVHVPVRGERHFAVLALVRPGTCVHRQVPVEGTGRAEHPVAHVAAVLVLAAAVGAAGRVVAMYVVRQVSGGRTDQARVRTFWHFNLWVEKSANY